MSDVEALIAEARELWDSPRGSLLVALADALEAALAVPATGEVPPEHRCEFYPHRDVMQCVCGNREVTP